MIIAEYYKSIEFREEEVADASFICDYLLLFTTITEACRFASSLKNWLNYVYKYSDVIVNVHYL